MSQSSKVIVVSAKDGEQAHDNCIAFTAQLNEEGDRNRLIAFLKSENMQIDRLIHN